MGHQAVMQDPQGAAFGLINLADLPKNAFVNARANEQQTLNQ
jgi:hypothetical protein